MRRLLPVLTVVLCLLGASLAPADAAPAMPSRTTWLQDTERAMTGAESYVVSRAAHRRPGERLAVVMDIDNTSLQTSYGAYHRAVPAVLRYARLARSKGVAVFFDTGRDRGKLTGVRRVLRRAGYRAAGICGRTPGEALAHSKVRCRRSIIAHGYEVISMVGNRSTDFEGGYYERGWKLPDYDNRLA